MTESRPAPVGEPLGGDNTHYCILSHDIRKMLWYRPTPVGPAHSGAEKPQDGAEPVGRSGRIGWASKGYPQGLRDLPEGTR
jgi:hypothetical protein